MSYFLVGLQVIIDIESNGNLEIYLVSLEVN